MVNSISTRWPCPCWLLGTSLDVVIPRTMVGLLGQCPFACVRDRVNRLKVEMEQQHPWLFQPKKDGGNLFI